MSEGISKLPVGWKTCAFEELVENFDGQRVPVKASERADRQGKYPYYGASGIIDWVDGYLFDGDYLLIAEDGANLLSRSSPIAFRARGRFWVNNHAHITRPRGDAPHGYFEAFLNSIDLAPYVTGTAQPKLTQKALNRIKVPVAPLNEQRRIVAKLETLQNKAQKARQHLEAIPALLQQLRQSILAAAFRGDLTKAWREQNKDVEPAAELLKRIRAERRRKWEEAELVRMKAKGKTPTDDKWKQKYQEPEPVDATGLPELPEGWCWASPDELSAPIPNSLTIGPFGSDLKVTDYQNFGVPLVFVRDIRAESFGGNQTKYITPDKAELLARHLVRSGDLLITKMGDPPGDTAVYPNDRPAAIITADCIKLTPFEALTDADFLKYCLRSQFVRDQLLEQTAGVAQQKLSLERFRTIHIPLPPRGEQIAIVLHLNELEERINECSEQKAEIKKRLAYLTQSLLAKAFRGELVPQDPNDEPAQQLLARLKHTPAPSTTTTPKTSRATKTPRKPKTPE